MVRSFSLLCLAVLLIASGCDTSDDGESGNESSAPATENGTASAASGTASSATATAADGATAGAGACGWGPTEDAQVPEGYVCGGDGADPDGIFAMGCPEGVTLEVGGECGGVEGPGCCDAQGNVWFCGDAGNGPVLAQIPC